MPPIGSSPSTTTDRQVPVSRRAYASAWRSESVNAVPFHAMSNAVPWSTEVRTIGRAERHVHSFLEREELHRRVTLVVVHADDRVVAPLVHRLEEDGVGGMRPRRVDPLVACRGDRRRDVLGVLGPEQPVLARVWVQAADRDTRLRPGTGRARRW